MEQISGFAPSRRCSSSVAGPPVNACRIFTEAPSGESVMRIAVSGADDDILESRPFRPGIILLWISAGLENPREYARSRVIREGGSWSIPQGIRHGTFRPSSIDSRKQGTDRRGVEKIRPRGF